MSRPLFTVTASGSTFAVREDLKEWGFSWIADEKHWVKSGCDDGQCSLFRHYARSAEWEGVELDFKPDAPVVYRPGALGADWL